MAGLVGADIDQLIVLASTFDRQSQRFLEIASSSSTALMVAQWTGGDVDRVRSEWNRVSKPAIMNSAHQLATLAQELRRQAEQQRETSGGAVALGHGGARVEIPGLPGNTWPTLPSFNFGGLPDWAKPKPGWNGTVPWPLPEGVSIGDFFDETKRVVDSKVSGLPWSWGDLGGLVPKVDQAFNIRDYADRIGRGEIPIHEMIGDVGGEMRSAGFGAKSPALYLGGAAIGIWDTVVQEAQKGDWSKSTFDNNMAFIGANPREAAEAAGGAIVAFVPSLIKNLKFW